MRLGCVLVIEKGDLVEHCRNTKAAEVELFMIKDGICNTTRLHTADIIMYADGTDCKILRSRYSQTVVEPPRRVELPEVFRFGFDPKQSPLRCLQHPVGIIIWCCIACCHLTDKHLDGKIMKVVEAIEEYQPKTYEQYEMFFQMLARQRYGVEYTKVGGTFGYDVPRYDGYFWHQVYSLLVGDKTFKYEVIDKQEGDTD